MIVKQTETGANDGLAVTGGIPSQTKARGNILIVAGDAFDDAEGLFRGGVDRGCRCEERADFHVVSYRSEEHTSELQSRRDLVCRLLLEKKNGVGNQVELCNGVRAGNNQR